MNKKLTITCVAIASFVVLFVSCKKDGMNSDAAKKDSIPVGEFQREYCDRLPGWTCCNLDGKGSNSGHLP